MASLTPAVVQNENLHIHKGKGIGGVQADAPKPMKTGRQERKALRDLSQAGKPFLSDARKGSTLKDKSAAPSRETAKKASKINILTDEETSKCREWAKEGIEHMHFSGNDMQNFEKHQQEERVKKKVAKAISALHAWTDVTFGLEIPKKEVPSDIEDVFKLEFEEETLPPTPRTYMPSKSGGDEETDDLFKLDDDSYFHQPFDIKLKEEYDGDIACF